MKRFICITLALVLALSLFCSCGKSRADKLMDRYTELANTYSSLSATVAAQNDTALLGKFSRIGIDLTDIATELSKNGDEMTDEALDEIETKLNDIEVAIAAIAPKEK
ncbi:MAG: hypothetical protein IJP38_04290 [Oscillospiraceae bacterium]|nr:hypothetical protein [Oscillospiraceae bacterium]